MKTLYRLQKAISTKAMLVYALVLASALSFNLAYGQVELTDEQTLQILGIGVLAAAFRAYLGYKNSPDAFDKIKFIDGFLTALVTTIPIALGAALTNTTFNLFGLVMVFFTTIGAGLTISELRKKSIPSNTP